MSDSWTVLSLSYLALSKYLSFGQPDQNRKTFPLTFVFSLQRDLYYQFVFSSLQKVKWMQLALFYFAIPFFFNLHLFISFLDLAPEYSFSILYYIRKGLIFSVIITYPNLFLAFFYCNFFPFLFFNHYESIKDSLFTPKISVKLKAVWKSTYRNIQHNAVIHTSTFPRNSKH